MVHTSRGLQFDVGYIGGRHQVRCRAGRAIVIYFGRFLCFPFIVLTNISYWHFPNVKF